MPLTPGSGVYFSCLNANKIRKRDKRMSELLKVENLMTQFKTESGVVIGIVVLLAIFLPIWVGRRRAG